MDSETNALITNLEQNTTHDRGAQSRTKIRIKIKKGNGNLDHHYTHKQNLSTCLIEPALVSPCQPITRENGNTSNSYSGKASNEISNSKENLIATAHRLDENFSTILSSTSNISDPELIDESVSGTSTCNTNASIVAVDRTSHHTEHQLQVQQQLQSSSKKSSYDYLRGGMEERPLSEWVSNDQLHSAVDINDGDDDFHHRNGFESDSTYQRELIAYLPPISSSHEANSDLDELTAKAPPIPILEPSVNGGMFEHLRYENKANTIIDSKNYDIKNGEDTVADIHGAANILCLLKSSVIPQSSSLALHRRSVHSSSSPLFTRSSLERQMSAKEYDDIAEAIVNDDKIMTQRQHRHILQKENEDTVINLISTSVSNIINQDQQHRNHPHILPNRLSLPEDNEELNSLHCFVRSDLLELFVVPLVEENLLSIMFLDRHK